MTHSEIREAPQAALRRFMMYRPTHFDVAFEINPWMSVSRRPDLDRAAAEWEGLVDGLTAAGAKVLKEEGVAGLPDLVFAADVAIASGSSFLGAAFRRPERRREAAEGYRSLTRRGFTPMGDTPGGFLEGGDVLAFGDTLVAGYGLRTTRSSHSALARIYHAPVVSVKLADRRFYHLDMSFCPLDGRRAIVAPEAWDEPSRRRILELVPEPLVIDLEEAATFCANSVVVGRTVIMSACPPRIGRQLEAWGFQVHLVQIDEFLKAGGGVRCMTLDLDLRGSEA